jgi:hypothetical protein
VRISKGLMVGIALQTIICVAVTIVSLWGETDVMLCGHVIAADLRLLTWLFIAFLALWTSVSLGYKISYRDLFGRQAFRSFGKGAAIVLLCYQIPVFLELLVKEYAQTFPQKSPWGIEEMPDNDRFACNKTNLPGMFIIYDDLQWKSFSRPSRNVCPTWDSCHFSN